MRFTLLILLTARIATAAPTPEPLRATLAARPTEAPLIVATALSELTPDQSTLAEDLVAVALATLGNSRAAIHAVAPAAALAAPDFAREIARGCLRDAPHYVTREEVYGLVRGSLVTLGRSPDFTPISPGGPLNEASVTGDANNP